MEAPAFRPGRKRGMRERHRGLEREERPQLYERIHRHLFEAADAAIEPEAEASITLANETAQGL